MRSLSQSINEARYNFTFTSKADTVISDTEKALKTGLFFSANLSKKIFLKNGKKRLDKIGYRSVILNAKHDIEDLGDKIEFVMSYKFYTVEKKYIEEVDKQDYLDYRVEAMLNQMYTNWSSDTSSSWDAEAAGVSSNSNVNPLMDCGFISWYAKKYHVDLGKQFKDLTWLSKKEFDKLAVKYKYK